jgi:hypothetical protein
MTTETKLLFTNLGIVGQFYLTDEDRRHVAALKVHDGVMLVAEPTNQADPNAVLVTTPAGNKLGYVPRTVAPTAKLFLDSGFKITAIVTGVIVNKNKNFTVTVTASRG